MQRAIISSVLVFLMPFSAFAALTNPLNTNDIYQFLSELLKLVAQIAFPVIVLFMVYIGFLFIAAQGDAAKLKDAKRFFFWALVGALLVLGAYALSLAIQGTVEQL